MERKKIALIWGSIPSIKNTTRFQRAKYLSRRYNCFFSLLSDEVSIEIYKLASSVKICPGNKYFSKIIFPIWILFQIFSYRLKKVEAVHTSFHNLSILSGFIFKSFGLKWILDIWDSPSLPIETLSQRKDFFGRLGLIYYKTIFRLAKRCTRYADLIILSLHPKFLDSYTLNQNKILYITNGTDLNIYRNIKPQTKNGFNLIYVGHIKKLRGIDTVLEAISMIKSYIPRLKLFLVGYMNPYDEKWLKNEIIERNLLNKVEIVGQLTHKRALEKIAESNVCLYPFPKKKELDYIYPIKVFEYMALGKVTIASNLRGVRQIIKDGVNGLLVEPDNPEQLTQALIYIYNNHHIRQKIEENAKKSVKQYDWEKINKQIGEVIDELLEEQR